MSEQTAVRVRQLIDVLLERGLLTVAAASCAAVFIAELIMKFIH